MGPNSARIRQYRQGDARFAVPQEHGEFYNSPTVGCRVAGCKQGRLSASPTQVPDGTQEIIMLYYAVVFLVIALIAGALGFFGVAGAAVGIAKILFFVFLVLFVVSLIIGRSGRGTI
jgi:uncharacterized membrane protein YtjA (UPF0391 family)